MTKPTETAIQDAVYWHANHKYHLSPTPNVYLYSWESDFISVTRTGFVHEFEIKTTRSDFRNDKKKTEKHTILLNGERKVRFWNRDKQKGEFITEPFPRPNYFWYVCPMDVIPQAEVPGHAGLIYCAGNRFDLRTPTKKAPRLHRDTITDTQSQTLATSLSFKYWNLRKKGM